LLDEFKVLDLDILGADEDADDEDDFMAYQNRSFAYRREKSEVFATQRDNQESTPDQVTKEMVCIVAPLC
jgi:hypothetical protein